LEQGTIDVEEFKEAVKKSFKVSDQEAMQAFQAIDANHDNEINYSEFLAAMVSSRIAVHDEHLRNSFTRFDVDGSGVITVDNLRTVLGESCDPETVEEMMKEADVSGDGQLDYNEWIAFLCDTAEDDDLSKSTYSALSIIDHKLAEAKLTKKETTTCCGGYCNIL